MGLSWRKWMGLPVAMAVALLMAFVPPWSVPLKAQVPALPFHRGTNILGYDPIWRGQKAEFAIDDLRRLRQAHFDLIRINMQPFGVSLTAQRRISPVWQETMDKYVDAALKLGFYVVIDYHDLDSSCSNDMKSCAPLLETLWMQLSNHYKGRSGHLIYELLNEPHAPLGDDTWNAEQEKLVGIIRSAEPDRTVIVSPTGYSSLAKLSSLRLPHYDHLIATFHYYAPDDFTKQFAPKKIGAGPAFREWGSSLDRLRLQLDFDRVSSWSMAHGIPIFLGEFGVWDSVPITQRSLYLGAVVNAAERRKFGWAQWQYKHDFSATDKSGNWYPEILRALHGETR